jgi:ribosomal protein S27AE
MNSLIDCIYNTPKYEINIIITSLTRLWGTFICLRKTSIAMEVEVFTWAGLSSMSLISIGITACCCGGPQQQQQQQVVVDNDDDEPKRICPDCGIENPRDASHCGDCGFEFKSGNDNEEDEDA